MKAIITKLMGKYSEAAEVGEVHLLGAIDTYACGLAGEDYEAEETTKPITCGTCMDMLKWAKKAAKVKN